VGEPQEPGPLLEIAVRRAEEAGPPWYQAGDVAGRRTKADGLVVDQAVAAESVDADARLRPDSALTKQHALTTVWRHREQIDAIDTGTQLELLPHRHALGVGMGQPCAAREQLAVDACQPG
jgi:hypothetical protein